MGVNSELIFFFSTTGEVTEPPTTGGIGVIDCALEGLFTKAGNDGSVFVTVGESMERGDSGREIDSSPKLFKRSGFTYRSNRVYGARISLTQKLVSLRVRYNFKGIKEKLKERLG